MVYLESLFLLAGALLFVEKAAKGLHYFGLDCRMLEFFKYSTLLTSGNPMTFRHFWSTVGGKKYHSFCPYQMWSKQAGVWIHFCMKRLSALTGGKSVVKACANLKTAALHYIQHQRGPTNIGVGVVQSFFIPLPSFNVTYCEKERQMVCWWAGDGKTLLHSARIIQECGRSVQQAPLRGFENIQRPNS